MTTEKSLDELRDEKAESFYLNLMASGMDLSEHDGDLERHCHKAGFDDARAHFEKVIEEKNNALEQMFKKEVESDEKLAELDADIKHESEQRAFARQDVQTLSEKLASRDAMIEKLKIALEDYDGLAGYSAQKGSTKFSSASQVLNDLEEWKKTI